jgi:hypothetical protein
MYILDTKALSKLIRKPCKNDTKALYTFYTKALSKFFTKTL